MHILRCTEGDRQWRAIQSWNCFKRFTEKRKDYNSDKLLSSVDEKISCALAFLGFIFTGQPKLESEI